MKAYADREGRMKALNTEEAPFVRTDFSDEAAWRQIAAAVRKESGDGFLANIDIVSDVSFDGADPIELAAATASGNRHAILFVVDAVTMRNEERPILCLNLHKIGEQFRVLPSELWGVENNLSLANMDFHEFAESADPDGIFRGFK